MPLPLVASKRCHDLSNELLSRIFDYFDDGRPRTFPPDRRKLGAYDALARVCRRWGLVVRAHIWRSIAHPNIESFLEHWGKGKLTSTSFVRHLRMGFPEPNVATLPATPALRDLATSPEELPLPNLRKLEHTESISSNKLIEVLSVACSRLEELTLYWDWYEGFPKSEMLPNLRTLRLYTSYENKPPPPPKKKRKSRKRPRSPSPPPPPPPPPLQPFNHLTTLYVHNSTTSKDPYVSTYHDIFFPQLRVLRLEDICHVWRTYEFIQRHPSILEVSLELDTSLGIYFRLESLVKLIGGTGVWRASDDDGGVVVDQAIDGNLDRICDLGLDEGETNTRPSKCALYGLFSKVAFSRAPLPVPNFPNTDATPTCPRYKCTGLAVYFEEVQSEYSDEMSPGEFGYDSVESADSFIRDIVKTQGLSIFRDVEELRLGSDLFYSEGPMNLKNIMTKFGDALRLLPSLHKFTLWLPRYRSFTFSETSSATFPTLLDTSDASEEFSDDLEEMWNEPRTLADLHSSKDDMERIEAVVRDVLGVGPDEDLDKENVDLMPVWELYNYPIMETIVRDLASTCRHLEQFEWWALEHSKTNYRTVIWDWKIQREKSARARGTVKAMSGHLTWTEPEKRQGQRNNVSGGRGKPPEEFPVLIGEELEKYFRLTSGRSCAH